MSPGLKVFAPAILRQCLFSLAAGIECWRGRASFLLLCSTSVLSDCAVSSDCGSTFRATARHLVDAVVLWAPRLAANFTDASAALFASLAHMAAPHSNVQRSVATAMTRSQRAALESLDSGSPRPADRNW